jgi:hypothetical protein
VAGRRFKPDRQLGLPIFDFGFSISSISGDHMDEPENKVKNQKSKTTNKYGEAAKVVSRVGL